MTDNLKIWDALSKTNPAHTKPFNRAGGFKGTSVKPIYTDLKMTENFGPCGTGWGINEPVFNVVPLAEEIAVYCTVGIWYCQDGGKRSDPVYGVGGDFVAKKNKNGLFADDEAFKKAYTDAIGNAMKHLGMSADVHMGQHDDDKYVTALRREFAETSPPPPAPSPPPPPSGKAPADFWKRPSLDIDPKREKTLEQFAESMKNAIGAAPDERALNKLIADNDTRLDGLCVEHRDLGNEVLEANKLRLGALMAA